MNQPAPPIVARSLPPQTANSQSPHQQEHPATDGEDSSALLCLFCRHPITSPQEAIAMDGNHQHTFFNPAGMVFQVGCFRAAPGCHGVGQPCADFSWFAATQWQIALCRRCNTHLGWRYSSPLHPTFFGLILTRLTHNSA